MGEANGVKVPSWAMGVLVTVFLSFLGFWGLWSVARADVDNLKKGYDELKPLASAVAVLNEQMPRMDRDIQEIKQTQKESQAQQVQFQAEMQRDIKTLLARSR